MASFKLHLLGTPSLESGAGRLTLERRDAALLALLAIEGPTPRSRVAQLVWPLADRVQAARNLRQRLFRLRRRCGVDVVEGDAVLALSAALEHDLNRVAERIEAAADAGSGELLGALDYGDAGAELADWVAALRERWRATRSRLIADAAERREAEGRIAAAIAYAERLVAEEPSAEHAHRRLMRLHYRRGDRSAALCAFERCRAALQRELGEAPGAETVALAAAIGRGEGSAATASASGLVGPYGFPSGGPADKAGHGASRPPPVALLRPPSLIGREAELATMAQAWGQGLVVIVDGVAGIGKSRLIEAVAGGAPTTLSLDVRAGDAEQPYALLAQLLRSLQRWPMPASLFVGELRRVVPELCTPPPGDLDPVRLQAAVDAVLAAAARQGVERLIIDDLQFAAPTSLTVLLQTATCSALPLRWLFALRPEPPIAALQAWLDGAAGERALHLRLPALDRAAVAELLASLALPGLSAAAWADALWRHAGGSPMFTLETLRAVLSGSAAGTAAPDPAAPLPVPHHVGQLIERRLAALPQPALRLVRLAALAAPDFSVALASRVLGRHALDMVADWRLLDDAHVLRGGDFAHDLVREAVLRGIPEAIAGEMHRQIAPVAAALGVPAVRVARHWQRAGEWVAAAAAYDTAAADARAAGLRVEQMRCSDQAAAGWLRAARPAVAFDALVAAARIALVCTPIDDFERRLCALDALVSTATQAHQVHLLRALALVHRDLAANALAPAQAAWASLCQASAPADPDPADHRTRETVSLLAAALAAAGRAPEALLLLQPLLPTLADESDAALRASLYSAHGFALAMAGQVRAAVASWRLGAAAAQDAGQDNEAMTDWSNAAGSLAWLGDAEAAYDAARSALQLGERAASRDTATPHDHQAAASGGHTVSIAQMTFGMLANGVGRYAEAESALQRACAAFAADAGAALLLHTAENHLANVYLHLGQFARAQRLLNSAPALSWRRHQLLARLAQTQGRPAQALLEAALAAWTPAQRDVARMGLRLDLAAVAAPALATAEAEAVLEQAQANDVQAVALLARLRLAQALLRAGRVDQSAALAAAAVQQAAEVAPYDLYRGAFWWQLAQLFESAGDRAQRLHALQQGWSWIERVSAFVPAAYRESFLQRNAANRALTTAR